MGRSAPRLVCWLVCWLARLLVGWLVSRLVGLGCLHLARSFAKLASFGIYCFTQPALHELLSFGWLYLLSVHALFAWLGWSAWLSSPQFSWGAQRAPHKNLRGESFDLRALVCFANLRDFLKMKVPHKLARWVAGFFTSSACSDTLTV